MEKYKIIRSDCNIHVQPEKVAIIIYLYYEDSVSRYKAYIDNIPKNIQIIIISSLTSVLLEGKQKLNNEKITYILKDNRGRDISALLIASKSVISANRIVCFIHDKKESSPRYKMDVELWNKCIWDNLLLNDSYIKNVISLFDNNKIGLLIPPKPMGDFIHPFYSDTWTCNEHMVFDLVKKMELYCSIAKHECPLCIGTAFWAKTEILEKLLSLDWKYEDFPNEPMAKDGTISHAIERIFQYLAEDKGYETITILNEHFAEDFLSTLQNKIYNSFYTLNDVFGIDGFRSISLYESNKNRIFDRCQWYKNIYVYGAGYYSEQVVIKLTNWNVKLSGIVVTEKKDNNKEEIRGHKIIELSELVSCNEDTLFVIGVNPDLQDEIIEILQTKGYSNYICYEI